MPDPLIPRPVTAEQFERIENAVTHAPTGAKFIRRGGMVVTYDWGLAGTATGAAFDPAEIKSVAIKLLKP